MISREAIKRRFDELWDSRIKQMLEETAQAGLDPAMSEALVLAVKVHSSIFMDNAGRMPAHLRDAYASCAMGLLREVTTIPADLRTIEDEEAARKIGEQVAKHREMEDAMLEQTGLLPDEQEGMRCHMDAMAEWLSNLTLGMPDGCVEIFLKMCRDQLEVLVKLHDEATAN
jgi:hypothetical protein